MTGLTYSTYVTQLAELAVVPTTDPDFQTILPQAIEYAELRMYRDIDFLSTVTSNVDLGVSISTAAYNPIVTFPQGTFVTLQNVNVILPAGQTDPNTSGNSRQPMLPVTKEYLQYSWNSSLNSSVPQYFAMINDNTIQVGPYPATQYFLEVYGTYRPATLSATNTTTFISQYLPDLFLMASMIYVSGYQRNFTSNAANDPQMPVNYETQYQTLLKSAIVEEARKKFQSSGWSSMSPTPVASPVR
jgi:hypothetical protein